MSIRFNLDVDKYSLLISIPMLISYVHVDEDKFYGLGKCIHLISVMMDS